MIRLVVTDQKTISMSLRPHLSRLLDDIVASFARHCDVCWTTFSCLWDSIVMSVFMSETHHVCVWVTPTKANLLVCDKQAQQQPAQHFRKCLAFPKICEIPRISCDKLNSSKFHEIRMALSEIRRNSRPKNITILPETKKGRRAHYGAISSAGSSCGPIIFWIRLVIHHRSTMVAQSIHSEHHQLPSVTMQTTRKTCTGSSVACWSLRWRQNDGISKVLAVPLNVWWIDGQENEHAPLQ